MMDACEQCGRQLGESDTPYVWQDRVVCPLCHASLAATAQGAKSGGPARPAIKSRGTVPGIVAQRDSDSALAYATPSMPPKAPRYLLSLAAGHVLTGFGILSITLGIILGVSLVLSAFGAEARRMGVSGFVAGSGIYMFAIMLLGGAGAVGFGQLVLLTRANAQQLFHIRYHGK